jgi:cell division protein FtsW (lipid II flippase)/cell division protein FtsI/penicillin-binding protein 2
MAVTRSWQPELAFSVDAVKAPMPVERKRELLLLAAASALVGLGLFLVYAAKTEGIDAERTVNINFTEMPRINGVDSAAATDMASYLARHRPLPNVGALARVRSVRPLMPKLKPFLSVRTPREYRRQFAVWIGIYFGAFWLVHLSWRVRRFAGDGAILPTLHLLTGLGLMLAVSLRDPLRDTLEFQKFAWGVAGGCACLLLPLFRAFDYRRYARWIYTPLLAAFALFAALTVAGSGPTGSDSKVNLGPFQPVEAIKVLLVFFMAGYFANRWEWLRDLRERDLLPRWLRWLDMPRFRHAVPVALGTVCALVLFFVLKDLGPALVTGFLFLALFAVARGRAGLALLGLGLLVAGVYAGYRLGTPHTVADRIAMWTSPWNNDVRGGDQIAHSFWALASGGVFGSGPGRGDPAMIPAGHTDLVMPAIAEELGFAGVGIIALLFVFLFLRALAAARAAQDEYGFFLALGCGILIAIEMLFISAGVLGLIPLSGVVSPFLSMGNSAMLANFFLLAVILGVSSRRRSDSIDAPFRVPLRWLAIPMAIFAAALVTKAAYIQTFHGDWVAKDSVVFQADGVKRPQHNPRLNSLARELRRGDIVDRNGVILATSTIDGRQYPFGPATAHLLGDLRTGEKFHATNASLIEHDQNTKLQGFRTYQELAPFVRIRHQPHNRAMEALRARDRTVQATIDVRLQTRAEEILKRRLDVIHQQHAALVVLAVQSGDVLALVSLPEPFANGAPSPDDALLDRARYGQYPPGSTFKLVTAIAALRLDPALEWRHFHCGPLAGGRVGARIPGWNKPIRDDAGDPAHGNPDMARAITVSCNAYFAQLGVSALGAKALEETAQLLDIPAGDPAEVRKMLPFAAYGQGPVLVTPFKMARVAATVANDGLMPQGRWVIDDSNPRQDPPKRIIASEQARFIADAMRSVATQGTARRAMAGLDVQVAGKTGTAQVDVGQPHSWFAGFAPFDAPPSGRVAFAVVVEHGGYGSQAAAPIARELVEAARDLGIIREPVSKR